MTTSHFNLKPRKVFCDWTKCRNYKKTVMTSEADVKCPECGHSLITDVSDFFSFGLTNELGSASS